MENCYLEHDRAGRVNIVMNRWSHLELSLHPTRHIQCLCVIDSHSFTCSSSLLIYFTILPQTNTPFIIPLVLLGCWTLIYFPSHLSALHLVPHNLEFSPSSFPNMYRQWYFLHHLKTHYFQRAFQPTYASDSASAGHCVCSQIIFTYLLILANST